MYWDYGGYSRKDRRYKTSGRFVIDLEGDDHHHFLMAIMTGCVLCGHKTVEDFKAALAQPQPKAKRDRTVVGNPLMEMERSAPPPSSQDRKWYRALRTGGPA